MGEGAWTARALDRVTRGRGGRGRAQPAPPKPRPAVYGAIDFAIEELGIESFASLDNGPVYGEQAFYAMDRPQIRSGVLANVRPTRAPDQLLTVIELAAEREGMRVVDGDFTEQATVAEIGEVDAVLLLNVLLHMFAPDWDQVLELYAPSTRCFVIANPQWHGGERTMRLTELDRESTARTLPPTLGNRAMFDQLDAWYPPQQRPYRDSRILWQWAIIDPDLETKLADLGFEMTLVREHGRFPGAPEFTNKTFVFSRAAAGPSAARR